MKKLLAIALLIAGTMVMVSCGDDEDPVATFDQPSVTVSSSGNIANGGTGTVVFSVSIDADLTAATWILTSTGVDAATIGGETTGTIDASGDVTVDITAGTTAGAATVTLEVTNPSEDPAGLSDDATAVFSVNDPADNIVELVVALPNDDGDIEDLLISDGDGITLPDFSFTGDDGLATLSLSINGGASIDLISGGATDGSGAAIAAGATSIAGLTVPGAAISDAYSVGDDNAFVFTASDVDGDDATGTIGVDIAEAVEDYSATAATDQQGNDAFNVVGEITSNVEWDADFVYIVTGRLIVGNGGTLTIPAGTIVKGQTGSGVNAKAIIVAVGGTINIDGEATAPVIMTSINDGLSPSDVAGGDFVGTLAPDVNGLWGGLIVLGDAPISASATQVQIEGIPTSVAQGLYGGDDEDDNSGSITYLSLRHGGSNIGAGNEINGITFGGAGSMTTVENVEVVANQDDGIEWFGGDVNVSNALIWNSGDDSMDSDQDWQGTVDGFIIVTPDGSAFELDGPEGPDSRDGGVHTFTNGTVYAGSAIGSLVDWDDNTNAALTNVLWFGIEADYTGGIASFGGDGNGTSAAWQMIVPAGNNMSDILATDDDGTLVPNAEAEAITTVIADLAAATVGVTAETDYTWTFASQAGGLSGIGL